ncbi:MAG TPA: cytochrome c [Pyrinomonadaceae bacterium]|jgi:mono/diheme cytochrome c family protein|nr:cytochrome c [Pyrinomonadaceae bacterium]
MLNRKEQEPGDCPRALAGPPRQQGVERLSVRRIPYLLLVGFCLFFVASCRMDMQDQPKYKVYRSSTFFKDGLSSRQLPEGTVPRGYLRADGALYTGKKDKAQAGQNASGAQNAQGQQNQNAQGQSNGGNTNNGGGATGAGGATNTSGAASNIYEDDVDTFPFPVTNELVTRGQERYQIFCSMCHGLSGYGDGMIVRRGFRKPPSYYEDRVRQAPVGHYYDVITKGWGAMPAYADQVPVQDRWAIVAYIRALQLTVPPGPQNGNTGSGPTAATPPPQQQQQSQRQQSRQPANSRTPKSGGQR